MSSTEAILRNTWGASQSLINSWGGGKLLLLCPLLTFFFFPVAKMFIFHSFGFTSKVILSLFFPDSSFENCTLEPLYTAAPISICCKFDNSLCCLYFLFPVAFFFSEISLSQSG